MNKLVLVLVLALCCLMQGCTVDGLYAKIPEAEFTSFKYDRAGNVTSAHIEATNSSIKDGAINIETLSIKGDYGPCFNFAVELEGYKRKLKEPVIE